MRDWTQENEAYFRAVRIEKTMMGLILMLIVAVAAFNIVATLVMVVSDKRTDIAILRTLGMSPRGVHCGIHDARRADRLDRHGARREPGRRARPQRRCGRAVHRDCSACTSWIRMFITSRGCRARCIAADVVRIAARRCSDFLATIYPAFQAAKTQPAEALRYE